VAIHGIYSLLGAHEWVAKSCAAVCYGVEDLGKYLLRLAGEFADLVPRSIPLCLDFLV
jgi:hypothetical protein